jgi:hypothetical protein
MELLCSHSREWPRLPLVAKLGQRGGHKVGTMSEDEGASTAKL